MPVYLMGDMLYLTKPLIMHVFERIRKSNSVVQIFGVSSSECRLEGHKLYGLSEQEGSGTNVI